MNQSVSSRQQIQLNIENIEQHYGVDSLSMLSEIIMNQKKAARFAPPQPHTDQNVKAELFANKYSFEQLVNKFPKPRSTINTLLLSILELKMQKEVIGSHHTRKCIWLLASGAKFNMNNHRGLYESLLKLNDYPGYYSRSIQQDLHRTVNKSTSHSTEEDILALKNVLVAFSRRNPYVGYCQGLNFIAFFLIMMQFTEEEAFWLLCSIIETIIPMDYYTNMIGVVCDQQIFASILKNTKPHIIQKFDEVGLDPSVLSIQWFVCLFTSSLPIYLVKLVWDRLIIQGSSAFIKTSLLIINYFQDEIMKTTQFHEIIMLLEKGSFSIMIPEEQFNVEFNRIYINREALNIARALYFEYYLKEKMNQKIIKTRKTEEYQCNMEWPICIPKLEKCKKDRQQLDVWIFRQEKPPYIMHDYLKTHEKKLKEESQIGKKKPQGKKIPQDFIVFKGSILGSETESSASIFGDSEKQEAVAEEESPKNMLKRRSEDIQATKNLIMGRMDHICEKERSPRTELSLDKIVEEVGESISENERSHTLLFYSKFMSENEELSMIIAPGSDLM